VRAVSCITKYKLAFADPPFGIGQKYSEYNDSESLPSFGWIAKCFEILDTNGVLALHGPDSLIEDYLTLPKIFGMKRIGWVNWHYRFGQCNRSNWIDSRAHCVFWAKGNDYTWNPDAIQVESDRVKYGDKRIADSPRGGKRVPFTVWGIPSDGPNWGRVQGGNAERWAKKNGALVDHPNQLPIVYLARIVKAYTNPGDSVFDAFCGSGTMPLVCNALGRDCLSVDISETTVESAKLRLTAHEAIAKERALR